MVTADRNEDGGWMVHTSWTECAHEFVPTDALICGALRREHSEMEWYALSGNRIRNLEALRFVGPTVSI